ncbi:MAG: nucleoside hydrolase, partial [bacterium]
MNATIPILLDTDIGSDIDDAVALAYLLRQPRCELVGITTVTGNVAQRAAIAQAVCAVAGQPDIPVHAGATASLIHGIGQREVPQFAALEGHPHRKDWPAGTAVEYLRKTIRSRPGELTLLSIGPFTNLALLFALDPEIPRLLKEVVSMAGTFFDPMPEWNCRVDPVATVMAYAARPPRHVSVGLDVTMKCKLAADEAARVSTALMSVEARVTKLLDKADADIEVVRRRLHEV